MNILCFRALFSNMKIILLLLGVLQASYAVKFTLVNRCGGPIWPGIQGSTIPEGGGFRLEQGKSRDIHLPDKWSAGRIWARTWCDNNMNCGTGFCGVSSMTLRQVFISYFRTKFNAKVQEGVLQPPLLSLLSEVTATKTTTISLSSMDTTSKSKSSLLKEHSNLMEEGTIVKPLENAKLIWITSVQMN